MLRSYIGIAGICTTSQWVKYIGNNAIGNNAIGNNAIGNNAIGINAI